MSDKNGLHNILLNPLGTEFVLRYVKIHSSLLSIRYTWCWQLRKFFMKERDPDIQQGQYHGCL